MTAENESACGPRCPRITDIEVDDTATTITIASMGDAGISWIGPGGLIEGSGEVFDFTD